MNQPTLIEAHDRVSSLMNQHGARVKFILILVKALVSGEWCNKNMDSSGKISMFFIGPNVQAHDEESLLNSLLVLEGKVFPKNEIKDLTKKEMHINTGPL